MEQLLNADGSPSFTTISDLRTNFEESFAKKQLGAAMKDIVVKSIDNIENNNVEGVLADEKIRNIVTNGIGEIADKAYTNDELNGSSYLGGLKGIVKEFAGMEANYREDLANAILSVESNKAIAGGKIQELFSVENLKFTSPELNKRFIDEINFKFGNEADEIVTEIGKDVGAAIAEAEEKNVIINETSKVIQDQKDEIREELSTTEEDEDEENKNESENDEEFDDSEDNGEEPENNDENETSEEGYEMGTERLIGLNSDERADALKFLDSQKGKIEKSFKDFYAKLSKEYDKLLNNKDEKYHFKPYFENEKDFSEEFNERLDKIYNGIHNKKGLFGNSRNSFKMKLCNIRGISNSKYIISCLLACIPYIGWIGTYAIVLSDEDEKKANKVVKETVNAASSVMETKIYIRQGLNDGEHVTYDLFLKIKINLKKFWQKGGLEDYDSEVLDIENKLNDSLQTDIENGKVMIGEPDINPDTGEIINVSDHTEEEIVGHEEPDAVPDQITSSNLDETPDAIVDDTIQTETDVGTESKEYLSYLYGNNNIAKVVVPLSPTRLDTLEIPQAKSLASIFAKGHESLDSLESVVTARFDILEDIVKRENDEELTQKFNTYKATATEAFENAARIQSAFGAVGLTAKGPIDADSASIYIASKTYKYFDGNLKVKNITPKKSFESLTDAIDAAFDIAVVKDTARKAKNNDDLIALAKDLSGREDLFWNNVLDLTESADKDKIKNIPQLADLDIDTKALIEDTYLENLKIAIDTVKVTPPGKTESEINEEIYRKSKEKIESFLGKDINIEQDEIIRAIIDGRDTSDFAPTPFEKFVIKFGTDKVLEKDGGKDFEIGQESANEVKNMAIVSCVLNQFVDKLNPMNETDTKEFKKYIGA